MGEKQWAIRLAPIELSCITIDDEKLHGRGTMHSRDTQYLVFQNKIPQYS